MEARAAACRGTVGRHRLRNQRRASEESSARERPTRTARASSLGASTGGHGAASTSTAAGHGAASTTSSAGHGTATNGEAVTLVSAQAASSDGHGGDTAASSDGHEEEEPSEGHEAPHWEYTGDSGPEYWGDMAGFELCREGLQQSPIDINYSFPEDLRDIEFHYQPTPLEVLNNGHTIQANVAPGSAMVIDGEEYSLLQFHFHTPSENVVNHKAYAMEGHLVHQSAGGELAVLGVFFGVGPNNDALNAVWDVMPEEAGETVSVAAPFDLDGMLPEDRRTYRFDGSLTTPPCSEGVKWNVLVTPIQLSKAQVTLFDSIIGENARPVQPLNGRKVAEDITG